MSDIGDQLKREVENLARNELDKLEREVRGFHSAQRGRPVAAIQADYRRRFGKALSADDARAYSEGAPLKVTKRISP